MAKLTRLRWNRSGVGHKQVVAHQLHLAAQLAGHLLPALPVLFVQTVLDGDDGVLLHQLLPVCDAGYEFFYNSNVVLKSDKRITASFDGTELKTVLDHVFSGTEFSYRIKDRTIVVVPRPAQPAPEEPAFVEIAGRITDGSNKAPMAGVTVVVEGSTIGTSSDADGRYVLKIPAGIYNIMFSFIGYEIHVKRYNGQNLADFRKISLTPTSVEVADVVVTGVYQRKKESFTGSATTFKSKELKAVGTQSVLQSLRTLASNELGHKCLSRSFPMQSQGI